MTSLNGIAKLTDVVAIEQAPPVLPGSTYEMIGQAALAHAQRPALSFFLRVQDHHRPLTWDYATLFGKITAAANFFHTLGIGKDDVIAYVLPNLPETHLVVWGGQASGIVFAINPMLEPQAIGELLRAGGAKALVTLAPFPGTDLWAKLQLVIDQVPSLRHLALVDLGQHVPGAARGSADLSKGVKVDAERISIHDFAHGLTDQPTDRLLSGRVIAADDFSSYFCTGGTTGLPKIAMRRHGNEVANAWSVGCVLGDGIAPGKTLFCGLPMFHVNAVMVTGLLPFSRGAQVILGTPQGWRGEGVISNFWRIVEHHHINLFSGVPTIYSALLQMPIDGYDLRSLEYGLCGAAPMPMELMRSFQERTGLKILEGYGLTEATCVSTVNPPRGERRLGSVGIRIPCQLMKAVVLNDAGAYERDCKVNEVGVLVMRGPNVFTGYKGDEHNKGLWVDTGDGERWLNTGDLGRQDNDGFFYLTGRKKELIIRGGHNIDPAVIEQPLHQHPDVLVAAAIGRPDAHSGEIPVAYVQLKSGSTATESELLNFVRSHIGERAAVPKTIRIIDAMPLTGVGKIFKPELKLRETQDSLAEALLNAGVLFFRVVARNDPAQGIVATVYLSDKGARPQVETALSQFPFTLVIDHD